MEVLQISTSDELVLKNFLDTEIFFSMFKVDLGDIMTRHSRPSIWCWSSRFGAEALHSSIDIFQKKIFDFLEKQFYFFYNPKRNVLWEKTNYWFSVDLEFRSQERNSCFWQKCISRGRGSGSRCTIYIVVLFWSLQQEREDCSCHCIYQGIPFCSRCNISHESWQTTIINPIFFTTTQSFANSRWETNAATRHLNDRITSSLVDDLHPSGGERRGDH